MLGGRDEDEWQTLREALDNPDGDRLYAVQLREARQRQAEREAAHREAQRPVCTRCSTKFIEERWQETTRASWPGEWDLLCGRCAREAADRAEAERLARRQAEEAERAAAEAPAVKPRSRFGIPPRSCARLGGAHGSTVYLSLWVCPTTLLPGFP
ncbi:hypothetical protein ACFZB2_36225 [Streptomyces bobili]|uniref:hypothetical protein n=1 Tax=Streptomyces bobili TaxID=67280 RepID=UPI0036EDB65C